MFHICILWILCIWTGPLLSAVFHSSIHWYVVLTWCCWREFSFCQRWFRCRNKQPFSPGLPLPPVSCCSSSQPPRRSILSAHCKAQSGRPPMNTDDSEASKCSAVVGNILVGANDYAAVPSCSHFKTATFQYASFVTVPLISSPSLAALPSPLQKQSIY